MTTDELTDHLLTSHTIVLYSRLQDEDAWSSNPFDLDEAAATQECTDRPGNSLADIDARLQEHACKYNQGVLPSSFRSVLPCVLVPAYLHAA